ncbi:MAG: hypothetical protein C5B50_19345 [Verrucomicrobia bacterium]|nr:MAG: hypothetical protein C5B50_19345 [Verrucomicrobiota bacterium]
MRRRPTRDKPSAARPRPERGHSCPQQRSNSPARLFELGTLLRTGMSALRVHLWSSVVIFAALTSRADDKITYQDHVLPIIQARCAKCHNEDKKKADLDLTSYRSALKGSGSGAVLVSGNPDGSKLMKSILQTEEPFMPANQGKIPDKDIDMIRKWIQGGLLENATGKAVAAGKSRTDFTLVSSSTGKPEGPPPMPTNLPATAVLHTARTTAITGLAASPWAPLVAVAGQKQILLFDSDKLSTLGILPFTEGQPVDVKFSWNGKLLLACGGIGAKSGCVVAWDITSGKKLVTLGSEYDTVIAADIRPDLSQVALGGPSRIVKIWSTKNADLEHKLKKHTDWVTAIAFSPNGQMLATADRNGGISIWDPDSGQELFTLGGHKSSVTALSWRSDSRLLASSSEDGTVKIWETDEGKRTKSWTAHGAGVLSVRYAHADRLVTCGRDGAVSLWDGNGSKVRDLEKSCDLPLRASFSSDDARIFASDFDGRVLAWNASTGKRIGSLNANP